MIILLQLLFSFGVRLVLCGGLKGFEDCTPSRQTFITQAYNDALALAQVSKSVDWKSQAPVDYFGSAQDNENFRPRITKAINAAADWSKGGHDILIRCGGDTCGSKRGGGLQGVVAGYAEHYDEKTKTRMPIIGLCEPFWQVPTIEEAIRHLKLSLDNQRNLGYMKTSGHAFLHEMMHLYEVSGQNNALDEIHDQLLCTRPRKVFAYGSQNTRLLAKGGTKGARRASVNADNYAWYATAVYFHDLFGVYADGPALPKDACPAPAPDPAGEPVDVEINIDGTVKDPEVEDDAPFRPPQVPVPRPRPPM